MHELEFYFYFLSPTFHYNLHFFFHSKIIPLYQTHCKDIDKHIDKYINEWIYT